MTNLDALRILPPEQMAEFLTEQRMAPIRETLEEYGIPAGETQAQVKAMFLAWLCGEVVV